MYGDRGFRQGPHNGGWDKHKQGRKARFPLNQYKATEGRRLMGAALAKAAAEMELPVSDNRYRQETEFSRHKRVSAYQIAKKKPWPSRPLKGGSTVFGRGRGNEYK